MAVPMANDPPFATLNHFAADLGIPSESDLLRIGSTSERCAAKWPFYLRGGRALWTAKASSFAPAFNFCRSQTGSAPLPAQVWPNLSRYLTATFRPFNGLLPPSFLEPISSPSLES